MKIKEITICVTHYIETDDEEYSSWRRGTTNAWECLMGESWEILEPPEGLEEAFQAVMNPKSIIEITQRYLEENL